METGWGGLFTPDAPATHKPTAKLRVVCLGSTIGGLQLLEALKAHPDVQVVGVATDAADDPQAKISIGTRIWRLFSPEQRRQWVQRIKSSALTAHIPVYTGAVKTPFFRRLLAQWQPDVIVMFVYGQILDRQLIETPRWGCFNFHPSHLSAGKGKGAQPYEAAIAEGDTTVRMTVHHVTEEVDGGGIVIETPAVRITDAQGQYPDALRIHDKVACSTVPEVTAQLIQALVDHARPGRTPAALSRQRTPFSERFQAQCLLPVGEAAQALRTSAAPTPGLSPSPATELTCPA